MKQVVINAAVLTISDSRVPVADGISPDKTSGCAMASSAEVAAEDVSGRLLMELLENEVDEISRAIRDLAERDDINLILTTGGTGISPRDVTPEATRAVIETEIPGIAEAMRIQTLHKTPFAMLSRGLAGLCNRKMVVNLPGSPKGVRECFEAIRPVLEHSIAIIAGGGHE
jgi:molybdenum cofactor synthesis domain-containing protein